MSIAKHHAEWLSLVEVSGPFLSLPVLAEKFPQGLDAHDPEHARLLRQVHEEWDENQHGHRPDPAIHHQWIKWVLGNTLDLDEVLVEGQSIPQTLKSDQPEHGETLRPDMIVKEPSNGKARLLVQTYPSHQGLNRVVQGKPWKASPDCACHRGARRPVSPTGTVRCRTRPNPRDSAVRFQGHQWLRGT